MAISQNPNGGVILNISSDLGIIAWISGLYRQTKNLEEIQPVKPVTYSVKTGLIGLTRYLATTGQIIHVTPCPGGVEVGQSEDFLNELYSRILLGRMARA